MCIIVDFLSRLGSAEFGLACHLGVQSGLPCVGVAKNLLQVQGVSKSEEHQSQVRRSSQPHNHGGVRVFPGGLSVLALRARGGLDKYPLVLIDVQKCPFVVFVPLPSTNQLQFQFIEGSMIAPSYSIRDIICASALSNEEKSSRFLQYTALCCSGPCEHTYILLFIIVSLSMEELEVRHSTSLSSRSHEPEKLQCCWFYFKA